MSTLLLCATFDSKTGVYGAPFTASSLPAVKRSLYDLLQSGQQNDMTRHPEDFSVFSLGIYDTDTAGFIIYPTPNCAFKLHEIQAELISRAQVGAQLDLVGGAK